MTLISYKKPKYGERRHSIENRQKFQDLSHKDLHILPWRLATVLNIFHTNS